MAFWFWAFSFAFSHSFFRYNPHSRLPAFVTAWLGPGLILASAWLQWRSGRRILLAVLRHAVGVIASVSPLLMVSAVQSRAPAPWHLSGDDAMGVGIDFLILCSLGIVSFVVLAVGLILRRALSRREKTA